MPLYLFLPINKKGKLQRETFVDYISHIFVGKSYQLFKVDFEVLEPNSLP